jgi:hypothetical protein
MLLKFFLIHAAMIISHSLMGLKMDACVGNETLVTASMYYNQPLLFRDRSKLAPDVIVTPTE